MRTQEIKETIERVIRTEYVAEDGIIFYDEDECKQYEESALFVVSNKLKRLTTKWTGQDCLVDNGGSDYELEVFDVQTQGDLDNLRRYLYLKAIKNGATEKDIKGAFTAENENRTKYVFDNVTIGHEVLIFWDYECEWFWVYNDGSLEGYFQWIRDNYNNMIKKVEE